MRIGVLAIVLGCAVLAGSRADDAQRRGAPVHGFSVVRSFPHDPPAFTQGLVFADGQFFESTGLHGESSVRRVEIETGRVLQHRPVEPKYFAEGLALVSDTLIQLTWQQKTGFVYDRATVARRRTFAYSMEGWGLAYDPKGGLVLSDGSDRLFFLDPVTYAVVRSVRVSDAGRRVIHLNELEWVEGELWANVWQTDRIARIDASTGVVRSWVDLTPLWPRARRTPSADVLNGIAYDRVARRIFVTGKKWPRVYEITTREPISGSPAPSGGPWSVLPPTPYTR